MMSGKQIIQCSILYPHVHVHVPDLVIVLSLTYFFSTRYCTAFFFSELPEDNSKTKVKTNPKQEVD